VLVDENLLKQAVRGIGTEGYNVPGIFNYIAMQTGHNMTPSAVMRAQYKLQFNKDLPLSAAEQAEEQLSPEFIEKLNNVPSAKRVMRPYLQMTGVQVPGQPYNAPTTPEAPLTRPGGPQVLDWVGGDPPEGYNPDGTPLTGQGGSSFRPELVPSNYGTAIEQAAVNTGLDPAILSGLFEIESNWDVNNEQPDGKIGLGNLDPEIAREYGAKPDDPESQINASAQYLSYLMEIFEGNMNLALYAYQAGPDATMPSGGSQYVDDVMTRSSKYGYKPEFPPGMNRALKQKLMSQ
jgi:hypothetical protein